MIKVDLSLLWTIINLVVFYLLLKKFLFKPVMGIMEKREQMIADGLKNASDRQEEAETLKKEYESALSGAKEESVKIVENARVEAKRQSDEILAERRKNWKPREAKYKKGVLRLFSQHAASPMKGAYLEY